MVDGRIYDGQLKYTIFDTCRPCHSILSVLKPVFCQIRHIIHCAYNSVRCLDLQIWQFLCPQRQRHDEFLYPLRMRAGWDNKDCLPFPRSWNWLMRWENISHVCLSVLRSCTCMRPLASIEYSFRALAVCFSLLAHPCHIICVRFSAW